MKSLLQQFKAVKSKYPDAVVLMHGQNEYFTFGNDAETLQKVCGIDKKFPACSMDAVLQKLVRSGYRVAIADPL